MKSTHLTKFSFYMIVVILIILVDQATKIFMNDFMATRSNVTVLPFLEWTLTYNLGAAFGFLGDASGWQRYFFTLLALGVSLYLLYWLWKYHQTSKVMSWAFVLILAGAVGNLIDRVAYGHVIDFILLHYDYRWFFPAFNVADMSITFGAILVLIDGFTADSKNND